MSDWHRFKLFIVIVLGPILFAPAAAAAAACEFDTGEQYFLQGNVDAAAAALYECSAQGERQAQSNFYLGIIARNEKRLNEAEAHLARAVSLAPDEITYRLELAVALEWMGRLADASDVYETILIAEPGNLPARLGVARMRHWQGHVRQSIKAYRELLQEHPDNTAIKTGLAFALLADQQLEPARALFADALRVNAQDASAQNGLDMLRKIRKYEVSMEHGVFDGEGGTKTRHLRAAIVATPSYALRWGAEVFRSHKTTRPLDVHGVPVYRSVKSARNLFVDYRLNASSATTVSWTREKLGASSTQNGFALEARHQRSRAHRYFAGARSTLVDGKEISLVSHLGYTFTSEEGWSLTGRFSHSRDREFSDARAVAMFWDTAYRARDYIRLGASINASAGRNSLSLSLRSVNYLTRSLSFSTSLVSDLADKRGQLTLGVNYEF